MVLTEALAAGTSVIASAIAGYSDVVTDGVDGLLVPPADPQRLTEELQLLHYEREHLAAMGEAARRSAGRYAWPHIANQVTAVYERAIELPRPGERRRAAGAGADAPQRHGRLARLGSVVHAALIQVRVGLRVFRDPRRGAAAAAAQLAAWAIQLAACWALLAALGLSDQAGIGAAAAVLFAVNVTAVVPATPSNIGVFQLAVISVLHTG